MLIISEMFLQAFSNGHNNIASTGCKMVTELMEGEPKNIEHLYLHDKQFLLKFLYMVDTKNQMVLKSIFKNLTMFCGDLHLWYTVSKPAL